MPSDINTTYGSWASEITSEAITRDASALSEITAHANGLFWLESRPEESGRTTLMHQSASGLIELTPSPYNVRSRVHEYGGTAYLIAKNKIFFVNFSDQNVYQIDWKSEAPFAIKQLTHSDSDVRFTDFQYHRASNRLICVQEVHGDEVLNTLATVNLADGSAEVLVSGHDFFSSPRLSPCGTKLAYLAWDHPNMPWDSTLLYLAEVAGSGTLSNSRLIAGSRKISVCQPEWADTDRLIFSSDETGWWNLKQYTADGVENLYPEEAEYGLPHWVFGMRFFAVISTNLLVCLRIEHGVSRLCLLDLKQRQLTLLDTPDWQQFSNIQAYSDDVFCVAGSPDQPTSIIRIDIARSTHSVTILHSSPSPKFDEHWFSRGQSISFTNRDGLPSHGYFYPPANPLHTGPSSSQRRPEEKPPPLLVLSHGGPTDSVRRNMNLKIQYYTSRGWAVYDSNYAGSTGFGRAYRNRLNGNWGLSDVADCVDAVVHLASTRRIDPERVAIKGGSAGGYTTLAALTFTDCFKAGASHYGIGDLEALARDTHKFEAHYLDGLVGPYPQSMRTYIARSPIHHTEGLSCPVIFFQGLDDKVVPPNQAEAMVAALKRKGVPVAYIPYAGEGHGFRNADNIKHSIESEYSFFAKVFGFIPADDLPDVNLQ